MIILSDYTSCHEKESLKVWFLKRMPPCLAIHVWGIGNDFVVLELITSANDMLDFTYLEVITNVMKAHDKTSHA